MGQKLSHKQYTKEFKKEAVDLVLERGYSVTEAAKSQIEANKTKIGIETWKKSFENPKSKIASKNQTEKVFNKFQ